MAYIVDADVLLTGKSADEGGLDLGQQATVLRLARMGHTQCLKSWLAYADLHPGEAEQVIKALDGELTKAAKPGRQKPKRGRGLGRSAATVASREQMVRADLAADLGSPDPARREAARAALARLERAG